MVGSLTSHKLAKRFGRKPLIGIAITIAGILLMLIPFSPVVLIAVSLFGLLCLLVSWMDTSSTDLVIEQDPKYPGIMMSMQRVSSNLGSSIGAGLGGLIILTYGYFHMFLVLGAFAILSAIMFYFFTVDPSKTNKNN